MTSFQIVDRWSWWQAALKGDFGQASESHPEQGYYRTRFKDGQWQPVAIWFDEESGKWLGYRNGREARDVNELWVQSLRQPITFEAYEKAMAGGGFDDEPPAPVVGHNSGDADPFEALRIEFEGEAELARDFLKAEVKTQADADKAGIWAKRLADISKRADGEREREKAPHLQASREVDDKWRPLVGSAKDMAASLKKHVEPFLIAQKRAEEARARKAAEEAAALRRQAEEARRAAEEKIDRARGYDPASDEDLRAATLAEADRMAAMAAEAEKAAQVKNASAGRTGARVALRTEKVGIVTDYAKAAAALVAMKHKDMLAEIDRLAQRAAKAGLPFDGMEIKEEEKAA